MTPDYFVFNGDADGICSLHQFQMAYPPKKPTLITGVKRDISLLSYIETAEKKEIAVFDIAVEKNLSSLERLLSQDCKVWWFDHHVSSILPEHKNFFPHIDISSKTNTALITSRFLGDRSFLWALVGLFGDNLHDVARLLGKDENLSDREWMDLQELGELLNYNSYGKTIEDLHFHPIELLRMIQPYSDPFEFIKKTGMLSLLKIGWEKDMELAEDSEHLQRNIHTLVNRKWSRRIIGDYANRIARKSPGIAHAVLLGGEENGGYVVSVRAAITKEKSAADFCKKFPTGGGRIQAAGINHLPFNELDNFVKAFNEYYPLE